jgi:hypothetical protein
MNVIQRLFEWWNKPRKPILRVTKHSPTNYWLHTNAWGDEGRWATPEEIKEFDAIEAKSRDL